MQSASELWWLKIIVEVYRNMGKKTIETNLNVFVDYFKPFYCYLDGWFSIFAYHSRSVLLSPINKLILLLPITFVKNIHQLVIDVRIYFDLTHHPLSILHHNYTPKMYPFILLYLFANHTVFFFFLFWKLDLFYSPLFLSLLFLSCVSLFY